MAIIDFLETKISKEHLKIALEVLNEFKDRESEEELFMIPSFSWTKLEQLEEFLNHLVNGKPLAKDTLEYIKNLKENKHV